MSQQFASGKFAYGLCDICGLRCELNKLRPTTYRGKRTGSLTCRDCWDKEHPQDRLPDVVAQHGADAEALREIRPDQNSDRVITGLDELEAFLSGY